MTDKQPDPLRVADELEAPIGTMTSYAAAQQAYARQARADLEAEIERLNAAATDSNLILERAQAANLEMLAAIERKDALLRQALAALNLYKAYGWPDRSGVIPAITKELSQ